MIFTIYIEGILCVREFQDHISNVRKYKNFKQYINYKYDILI